MKYIIQSNERQAERCAAFFAAIHGYSPFYVREVSRAKKFSSPDEAREYALEELFTSADALTVIPVSD